MILNTMYGSFSPECQIHCKKIKRLVDSLSNRIDAAFNLKVNSSLGCLSTFGALLQKCEELELGILEKMKGQKFIEFGPGLGFASQFYSKLFETNGIHYDLAVVTEVRNLCLNEYMKHNSDFFIQPEEFEIYENLEEKVSSLDKYSFISTWAFTESPLSVREKFEHIISNSNIALIVSNKIFGGVDNFHYLEDMAGRLKNHKHVKCDLGFLENAPSYKKRHELHLFVSI